MSELEIDDAHSYTTLAKVIFFYSIFFLQLLILK